MTSGRWAVPRPRIGVAREATPLVARLHERGMLGAFRHCCWVQNKDARGSKEGGGGDGLEDEVAGDGDGENPLLNGMYWGRRRKGCGGFLI
jgi:hypothetical protein